MDFALVNEFDPTLEAEWDALLDESITHVPFLRYEYLRAWWQTRGGGEWQQDAKLLLVTARNAGKLVGAAPLFWTPDYAGTPALLLVGAVEISDYLDVLSRPADLPNFAQGLLAFLVSADLPEWKTLQFHNLLNTSPALAALQSAAEQRGWQVQSEVLQHSPYIPLPGDFEIYLAAIDKKQRHEVRRKMHRLEESGVPFRWYVVSDASALDAEVDDFMRLMATDPQKESFLTPQMREHMHLVCRCAFEAGCLHLAFLEIEGQKAAGYLSFDYLNRLWVYNSGLDRAFTKYSPGWVLLGYLLQWANENKRSEFDFMRGDEDYKYRFGAVDRLVMRLGMQP